MKTAGEVSKDITSIYNLHVFTQKYMTYTYYVCICIEACVKTAQPLAEIQM